MLRYFLFFVLILVSASTIAVDTEVNTSYEKTFYKDWRLNRPYLHGLLVGFSLGVIESTPKQWKEAGPLEPSGIPSGLVDYIVKHSRMAFWLGVISAVLLYLYFILSCIYRYRFNVAHARFHYYKLMAKDNEYRKTLN